MVVAHGTGSRPAFVRACLQRPLALAGLRLVPVGLRGHNGDPRPFSGRLDETADDLAAAAHREGATVLGGLSLGAHAAAHAAVTGLLPRLTGVMLVWPAWTGGPGSVAAANARQADELERDGLAAVLARVRAGAPGWVADEVVASWSGHGQEALVPALRAVATSKAPTLAELGTVRIRAAVTGMTDDPLHPAAVGRTWAAILPRGAYRETSLAEVGADREAVGRALAQAWLATAWLATA